MEDLSIRRNRSFAAPQRQTVSRSGKTSASSSVQKTGQGTGTSAAAALRQLIARPENSAARRMLQTGEGVLAEVQEKLGRMAELAEEAAGEGGRDPAVIQEELDQLRDEVDRMTGSVQLFADEGAEEVAGSQDASGKEEAALPGWLTNALTQGTVDPARLLAALGLDKTASGMDLLAAIAGRAPESDPTAGYLAALYLGAVIAKGLGDLDPAQALDGLRQLLEKTAAGMPPDEVVRLLTGGEYTSLEDFQAQLADGTRPDLQAFLEELLLSDSGALLLSQPTLLDFMMSAGSMDMDLMSLLMTLGQTTAVPLEAGQEDAMADAAASAAGTAAPEVMAQPMSVTQFGDIQVMGRDLSGVSYNESTGQVTIGGTADVTVRGAGDQPVQITGSGTVTLQNVQASALTVDVSEAKIVTVGQNALGQVWLGEGAALTLDGRGLLQVSAFRGHETALLRLTGGALAVTGETGSGEPGAVEVPVILDGPVVLAAHAASVQDLSGRTLEPFDVVWNTLFPGFSTVASLEMNGQHARMLLQNGEHSEALRLWLAKGDLSSHGYPTHTLLIQGRDEAGQARTRYAYLRWDQRAGGFQEVSMYPNPFTVTGGEQDRDWTYEEETHTLHILSGQVTAVSGGAGTDARQEPFSGRIALMDRIGAVKLALGGVVCRVSSGRAFQLGCENDVTLVLRSGTNNFFESGAGCAGISMGEGTSLRVDCVPPRDGETAGTLTATGGAKAVGIGSDSGGRPGHIMIRGGVAAGGEKPGEAGSVTIAGSSSTAGSDLGSSKTWARMGVFLQMGADAVILPQFPLSSRTLQLNKLRVSTREYARAARTTIDADRRWVSQIQTAYSGLSSRLERWPDSLDGELLDPAGGPVRDSTAASVLMRQISRSAPILSDRAMQVRSLQSLEEVNRLLRH